MPDRPHVLLVNDDGIHAEGIKTLYRGLQDVARVTVAAPQTEQSARSQAITLFTPITWEEYREDGQIEGAAVYGTPVDCVKLALKVLLADDAPDMIISGINEGSNTGVNVLYSGTVGAAMEGALHEIPSIALSVCGKGGVNFLPALDVAREMVSFCCSGRLPRKSILNINVPNVADASELRGYRATVQARTLWNDEYEERFSPHHRPYYWLKGQKYSESEAENSDEWAVRNHFISVTPLHVDMTDHDSLKRIDEMGIFPT